MKNIIKEIKNLPYNIKNICGWIKILWNNFDWDHSFLLDILEYKLSKMKSYFEKDTIIARDDANDIVAQLNLCIFACNQLNTEEYETEIYAPFHKKHPFRIEEWEDENGNKRAGLRSMKKEECDEWMKLYELSNIKNKELRNQLFDTMKKNFDSWWD
jgi:hypothetical protein